MSIRWRLTAALLVVVVVAVGGLTVAHMLEVGGRLEEQLHRQVERVVASVQSEMAQTGELLDEEVAGALDPGAFLARSLGSTRVQQRYLSARGRLQEGRLEILKVLSPTGQIVTSGHWPASYGALDPNARIYAGPPGEGAVIVDEPTPSGSRPSLQRWAQGRWGRQDVIIVVGRFLDHTALERMRARIGADLLALCQPAVAPAGRCITVKNPTVLPDEVFTPTADWISRLELASVPLGMSPDAPVLHLGLDRSSVDDVSSAIVLRALLVGFISILLSMALGVFIAARIVRPVEALADAAGRLADGDLGTRVEGSRASGPEVRGLVDAFNSMAADMERSQTQLKQAERVAAWREIARGLAHELKNPLTPILGAMDVIRRARKLGRKDFDDILDEQADAVVEEVMRLKELADAFARFARLPDPKIEPVDLAQALDNAVALYTSDGIEVNRDYGEVPAVHADKTQVGTVITNLVKNAAEAMENEGTLSLALRVDVDDEKKRRAVIIIDDSGPGIAPEIQDRLFTPYVTTKGSRGTGLGLALVHRIVLEHGGDIEAGAGPGGGARFTVRLPLPEVRASRGEAEST
jgi:signal transduction histidine kinase